MTMILALDVCGTVAAIVLSVQHSWAAQVWGQGCGEGN